MLKKFVVRNYKNFKNEICLDLENRAGYQFNMDCISNGMISKSIIYGKNATGKTNLGRALMDIRLLFYENDPMLVGDGAILNADSKEKVMAFSYTFQFSSVELVYQYTRFSNQKLQMEKLSIDHILIYQCDFENREFDFHNLEYIGAETANTERYLQSLEEMGEESVELHLPFLKWLIGNVLFHGNSVVLKLTKYIYRMRMITVGNIWPPRMRNVNNRFYEVLENTRKLKDLEEFFNMMGIACQLALKKLPDGQIELYFEHENLVPFYKNASSGTLALFDLYCKLILLAEEASFLYLDEFDAFYHYEMAENVIKFLKKKYPDCQIIMTSHNTSLMTNRFMRPDCLFILSEAGVLTPLCNATGRELREGHNLEKMYISGEFEKYE